MAEDPRAQIEDLLHRMERVVAHAFDDTSAADRFPVDGKFNEHFSASEYLELIIRLCRSTRKDALFVNGLHIGSNGREVLHKEITRLAAHGATVSLICRPDEIDGNGQLEFLRTVGALPNGEARISGVRLNGMFVFDRRQALIWSGQQERRFALVNSPVVLEPILHLTDALREVSCELDAFTQYHQRVLDETSAQVLRLLSSGRKDEVAARELGVSVRTYRRYVASLLGSLGATSRFEAGVKAAALRLATKDR